MNADQNRSSEDRKDPECRVAEICHAFETQWRAGQRPTVEEFLEPGDGALLASLIRELVVLDAELRRHDGENVTLDQYLERFPDHTDELVTAWAGMACRQEPSGTDGGAEVEIRPEDQSTSIAEVAETEAEHGVLAADGARSSAIDFDKLVLGRYRFLHKLGSGGYGDVFAAADEKLQRTVAIKVFKQKHADWSVESYLKEARVLASLDHPNIVPVYDVVSTMEIPLLIISRMIDGTNLASMNKEGGLPPEDAVALVEPIARALHSAHSSGVVHRDVKPANILVDQEGLPFVCDFGLALRESDYGRGPKLAGTIRYMSPEQARGESDRVDGRSDIYSLGVVLYELLTGRRPFEGEADQVLEHIATQEVRPPRQIKDSIPEQLESICLKALSMRLADRYTTAVDMANDLLSFVEDDKPVVVQAQVVASAGETPVSEEDDMPVVATSHPLSIVSTLNPFNWVILFLPLATLAFVDWRYSIFSLLLLVTVFRPLFSAIAQWWTTEFRITGNRVMARNLATTLDVPVERVERMRIDQDAIGRTFDFGTLFVYSEGGVSIFSGVRSPRVLKESIEAKALSAPAGGTSDIIDLATMDQLGARVNANSASKRQVSPGTGFLPRSTSESAAAGVQHVGPDYQAILGQNVSKKWLIVVLSIFVLTVVMTGVFLLAYPYWLDYSARQTHAPTEVEQKTNPIP